MKKSLSLACSIICFGALSAQESPVAAGGEAKGSGGTVSYSIGQVLYHENTSVSGTISEGVQQAFEIFVTVGIEEERIQLEMSAYPNPVRSKLNLLVENTKNLNYHLLDMQGKVLKEANILVESIEINLENYPPAIYFLQVSDGSHQIKTFKIIKNQ